MLLAYFPIDILVGPFCPAESVKYLGKWFDSDFPCLNMFRVSAKVVLCNFVTSDMSGGFLLMMPLYLWPMLLSVVGWIIVIHFSGVSPGSIYINYNISKIVQLALH